MPLEILVLLITIMVIGITTFVMIFILRRNNKRNKNAIVLNIVPEPFEVNFTKAKRYSAFIRRTSFSLIGVAGALTGTLPQLTMNIVNKQTGEQVAYNPPSMGIMTRNDSHRGALLPVGKFTITESGLYNLQIIATQNIKENDLLEIK